jgi:hypothetical protein
MLPLKNGGAPNPLIIPILVPASPVQVAPAAFVIAPAPVYPSKEVSIPKLTVPLGVCPKLVFDKSKKTTVVKHNNFFIINNLIYNP